MILCIQTFGRAAWHSVLTDPIRLLRFWGFLRWNTAIFIAFMVFAYLLALLGNMIAVGVAPDAVAVEGVNGTRVAAACGIVEAGLFLQTSFMLVFTVLVLRWNMISKPWEVEWDPVRKLRWTWKKLLRVILACIAFLMVSVVCQTTHSSNVRLPAETGLPATGVLPSLANFEWNSLRIRRRPSAWYVIMSSAMYRS